MKILVIVFAKEIHQEANPFSYTLIDEITSQHTDVEVFSDPAIFWNDDVLKMDIVHVMWPQCPIYGNGHSANELEWRIRYIKEKGVRIVATCHNLKPHYTANSDYSKSYDIVYGNADVIVHLGNYSKEILQSQFSGVEHVIISHHVYDTLYSIVTNRDNAGRLLNLRSDRNYILSMGAFRDEEERDIIKTVAKLLKDTNYYVLAPSYNRGSDKGILSKFRNKLNNIIDKITISHLVSNGGFVPDELLPYYYALSDIALIQRRKILNSGNVPMAMYMGCVIIGPNVGNVGELLKETGNICFDPNNLNSLSCAVLEALECVKMGRGKCNRTLSLTKYSTFACAEAYYKIYLKLL